MPDTVATATDLPAIKRSYNVIISCGVPDTILIRSTMEIPFPTPLSVILSPIHIRRAEPAVIAATTVRYPQMLRWSSRRSPFPPRPTAIAQDSKRARPTVRYLVYSAIFFLPSSPSFCISSSFGIAIVSNCIMMEDVIYGVILNAKIDMEEKDPPVIALKNPIPEFCRFEKKSCR